jgi:serine/threonine-protein kinase
VIGSRLAHYEITSHLGTGGMGEVYQATDSRLGRSVAIKFLPEAFTHDAERVGRFEREARVLASLSHPNIATIHGIDEANGRKFLVMELVAGETVADRLARGPIPLEDALPLAKQIADALEAAHDRGIVHRDLKPANIKITPEGQIKVLDFGLAKASETAQASGPSNQAQGSRLRAQGSRRSLELTHDHDTGRDGDGHDSRHGCVHVAGAGEGKAHGPDDRLVGVRLCPVRDAHSASRLRG